MRILYTRPSFASLQKIYSSLPYFYASNFNVTFNSKFCDKRHTLRCSETNGLAPILRVYSKKKRKKKERSIRVRNTRAGRVYGTHRFQAISQVRPIVELFCCTWLDSEWNFPYCRCLSRRPKLLRGGYALNRRRYLRKEAFCCEEREFLAREKLGRNLILNVFFWMP